jgi:hypothetical protein
MNDVRLTFFSPSLDHHKEAEGLQNFEVSYQHQPTQHQIQATNFVV